MVPGIHKCIQAIASEPHKLQDNVAELAAAKILIINQIPVRFVTPINRTGCDYDVEFLLLYFPGECICHAARLSSLSAVARISASVAPGRRVARISSPNN